jgi:hypothetical protein
MKTYVNGTGTMLSTRSRVHAPLCHSFNIRPAQKIMRSVSGLFLLASSWRLKRTSAFSNQPSFSSFISGVANSFMGGGPNVVSKPALDARLASLDSTVPALSRIQERLREQQTNEERSFRQNLSLGYGVGSPLHKVRLFDESNTEGAIRVTFYRDSASWCVSYFLRIINVVAVILLTLLLYR